MSDSELSHLIGGIYDCVNAPDGWAVMLDRTSSFVGGHCGHFLIFDRNQVPLLSIVGGIDPASGTEYEAHYAQQDPRIAGFFAHDGQATACHEVVDVRSFSHSELVHDFLIKWEARWCLAGGFRVREGQTGLWSTMRGQQRGAFTEPERVRMNLLLPHIRRAVELQSHLGFAADHTRSLEGVLEVLALPAFLLNPAGQLLYTNEAADTALAADGWLVLRAGELTARAATQATAIADAIRLASAPTPLDGAFGAAEVALGSPPGTAGRLLFYRLPGRAGVLALWTRPVDHAPPPAALLRARWGLTAGEAALCLALANGERIGDIARRKAVSSETVRTQLKQAFAKTGTHRQSDLLRLLHNHATVPLRL